MSMKTWIKTTQIMLSRKRGLSLCKQAAERQGMLKQLEDVHQGLSPLLGTRHKATEQSSSREVPPNPQVLYPSLGCSSLPQMDAKTEVCWATAGTSEEKKNKTRFPRGSVVKKPPATAGHTSSRPGQGRFHMLQSN